MDSRKVIATFRLAAIRDSELSSTNMQYPCTRKRRCIRNLGLVQRVRLLESDGAHPALTCMRTMAVQDPPQMSDCHNDKRSCAISPAQEWTRVLFRCSPLQKTWVRVVKYIARFRRGGLGTTGQNTNNPARLISVSTWLGTAHERAKPALFGNSRHCYRTDCPVQPISVDGKPLSPVLRPELLTSH